MKNNLMFLSIFLLFSAVSYGFDPHQEYSIKNLIENNNLLIREVSALSHQRAIDDFLSKNNSLNVLRTIKTIDNGVITIFSDGTCILGGTVFEHAIVTRSGLLVLKRNLSGVFWGHNAAWGPVKTTDGGSNGNPDNSPVNPPRTPVIPGILSPVNSPRTPVIPGILSPVNSPRTPERPDVPETPPAKKLPKSASENNVDGYRFGNNWKEALDPNSNAWVIKKNN